MSHFLKMTFIFALCSASLCVISAQAASKDFILRITSRDPGVFFKMIYMVMVNPVPYISGFDRVTPFEMKVRGNFVGIMLEANERDPQLKLEIIEEGSQVNVSGLGHSIFAHEDAGGMGYINAR